MGGRRGGRGDHRAPPPPLARAQVFKDAGVIDASSTLTREQFAELLGKIDAGLRALPATAQVAKQQGDYLADVFRANDVRPGAQVQGGGGVGGGGGTSAGAVANSTDTPACPPAVHTRAAVQGHPAVQVLSQGVAGLRRVGCARVTLRCSALRRWQLAPPRPPLARRAQTAP